MTAFHMYSGTMYLTLWTSSVIPVHIHISSERTQKTIIYITRKSKKHILEKKEQKKCWFVCSLSRLKGFFGVLKKVYHCACVFYVKPLIASDSPAVPSHTSNPP